MKSIVLLCGVRGAGKTNTLKKFFGVKPNVRLSRRQLLERDLEGKKIYAVSLGSPQEQSPFCNVEKVKDNIQKRIDICETASHGQEYVLLIPYGVYRNKQTGELNEKCVFEPIEWLKSQGFRILVIYLNKMRPVDLLMKTISSKEIESTEDYARQSTDLENLIKNS